MLEVLIGAALCVGGILYAEEPKEDVENIIIEVKDVTAKALVPKVAGGETGKVKFKIVVTNKGKGVVGVGKGTFDYTLTAPDGNPVPVFNVKAVIGTAGLDPGKSTEVEAIGVVNSVELDTESTYKLKVKSKNSEATDTVDVRFSK